MAVTTATGLGEVVLVVRLRGEDMYAFVAGVDCTAGEIHESAALLTDALARWSEWDAGAPYQTSDAWHDAIERIDPLWDIDINGFEFEVADIAEWAVYEREVR